MPVNAFEANKTWLRYSWCRDNGHNQFVEKADLCERHFQGDQWELEDKNRLRLVKRPSLTINKILGTVSNVMGEQINNRADTAFRPRNGADPKTAETLNKVYKQIADSNQLGWKRSDMFGDGVITSRGFLDVRLDYNRQMQGEVKITSLNPKNIIVDPDADEYDPDTWGDVFITKWATADDIAILYNPDDAEYLRNREQSYFPYGYDSIETDRDRFGMRLSPAYTSGQDNSNVLRSIRVIDRQYRKLDKQKHFLSPETGDMRAIPNDFSRDKIAFFVEKFGFQVVPKLVRRIRWTVIADYVVLHDDWSPYEHFTVVPYFPHFRHGKTIGLVENLTGPQELLNKVTSQELHVLNTTANSGWKVKAGALLNMTLEDLEARGAQTGLVVELNDMDGMEKITPNATPQGLDRMSFKAEESIKSISGVSDSMQGFDREDVAAKAIQEKKKSGATNLVKPFDNLERTDFFLARAVLSLVQNHYTEPRILTITKDHMTGETEDVRINHVNPDTGEIENDLTLGEYGVVITSVPHKETAEDDQFAQAVSLRELGVKIPDSILIKASRLQDKADILQQMQQEASSPEAQAQAAAQAKLLDAEVAKTQAEAGQKQADAGLKGEKTKETMVKAEVLANTPIEDPNAGQGGTPGLDHAVASHEAALAERAQDHTERMDFMEHGLKREVEGNKLRLQAQDMAGKRADAREAALAQAASAAQKPQPNQGLR